MDRYRTYQSIPNVSGNHEQGTMDKDLGFKVPKKIAALLGISLCVLGSIFFVGTRMTADEREIAHRNGLSSSWFPAHAIRKAQRIADASRESFLGYDLPHLFERPKSDDGVDASGDEGEKGQETDSGSDSNKTSKKSKDHNQKSVIEGCEATIMIIRHCEKGSVREHCAFVGFERSVYLSSLFGDGDERWPAPSHIYALGPGGRHNKHKLNFREIETVGALSEKVDVPVDYSFKEGDTNKLARTLLHLIHSGEMCGKLAVVSWKHSNIGHLAHRLGCGPNQGCPVDYKGKTFDEAWQLKYVYREFSHSDRKSLKLPSGPEWKIFGSAQPEGFDPLAFSKRSGDYPKGGVAEGGRWMPKVAAVPERSSPKDTDWKNTTDVSLLARAHG